MPAASSSPTVAAWELALRLRERREQLGIEVKVITQTLNFSRNYWSAVENERKLLSRENLTKLVKLLEFDKKEQDELLTLREIARGSGWWTPYSQLFGSELQRLYGLEAGAQSIRGYENILIPGLLQTPDYMRKLMLPDGTIRPVEVEQRVEARLQRQERLISDDPLELEFILSEAVLTQQIGGPRVLKAQLQHLAGTIEKSAGRIAIQVIPFTATACGLFGSSTMHLIDFENPRLPTLVWHETVTSWGIVHDPNRIRDINVVYTQALDQALDRQSSLDLVQRRIEELG